MPLTIVLRCYLFRLLIRVVFLPRIIFSANLAKRERHHAHYAWFSHEYPAKSELVKEDLNRRGWCVLVHHISYQCRVFIILTQRILVRTILVCTMTVFADACPRTGCIQTGAVLQVRMLHAQHYVYVCACMYACVFRSFRAQAPRCFYRPVVSFRPTLGQLEPRLRSSPAC